MAHEPTFQLRAITPTGEIFRTEVVSVVAPAALGLMGILANHAPLVTTTTPGVISYRTPQASTYRKTLAAPGLLEVHDNLVTIMTERWPD